MSSAFTKFNRISSRQHGPVTRAQALKAGVTHHQLRWRVRSGELLTPYSGIVVPASAPPSPLLAVMAACLATGGHASGACAAELWGLRGFEAEAVEVTIPYGKGSRPPGLIVHRSRNLDSRDLCTIDRVPITTVARTLIDVAGARPELAEGALSDAIVRAKTRRYRVESALARAGTRGCPGAAMLRRLLAELDVPTESVLEDAFVALIRRYGLPEPRRQVPVAGGRYTLDFGWRPAMFAVETDGGAFHCSPADRRRDREKVAQARREGWTVRRAYWDDVTAGADGLAVELAAELALRGLLAA
ncbi:MAG: type IV toxin-antitoxin system AbiEi family antitoxin domain-containing protein [Acidimicrobiia bacterium]